MGCHSRAACRPVELTETDKRTVVARGWREGWVKSDSVGRVSVQDDDKVLEMGGSDGYTIM